jgi:hypothetical protein
LSIPALTAPKKLGMAHLRNAPCPCGSGKKAKKCCLLSDGSFCVRPMDVRPKAPPTGFAHEGCYLAAYRDCSEKLSREHYLSKGILRALEAENGPLTLTGLPWLEAGEVASLPPTALAARVLCERHNNCLSPLDSAALRLFHAFRQLREPPPTNSALTLLSGHDVERWLLKTLLGILAAGIVQVQQGRRLGQVLGDTSVTDLLFDSQLWAATPGLGLYFLVPEDMEVVERGQVAFHPMLDTAKKEVLGGLMIFRGFDLLVGTSSGITGYERLQRAVHRPFGFLSDWSTPRREVRLSWADGRPHRPVLVAFTGKQVHLRPHL